MSPGTIFPDVPVRLAIGPPAATAFAVRGPDGKPVAGARIRPRVLHRGSLSTPDGLAERIEAGTVTDAEGRAVLAAFLPEEVSTVFVTAAGLGSQQFGFGLRDVESGTKVINLLPVGRLKGRIAGESPELIRNQRLSVVIWNRRSSPPPATALFTLTTDAEGRFEIPEIPEGELTIGAPMKPQSPWYLKSSPGLKVEAGKTVDVVVPFRRGVRVHGVVRERGSGRPIANVGVGVDYGSPDMVRTDANGRYECFAIPRRAYISLSPVPEGYTSLMYGLSEPTIPADAADFEMPPIELSRAGDVRGDVVDAQGKPVAGALVVAAWAVDEGPNRRGQREASVRTDGRGEFRVDGVPLDGEVTLSARLSELRTPRPVATRVGAGGPTHLRLDDTSAVALMGRVVDKDGNPLAGAAVHLRAQRRYPSGQVKGDDLVDFDGIPVLTSDAAGRFRTPRQLDRDGEYAAFAAAEGFRTERTLWVSGGSVRFPDLVLQREIPPSRSTIAATVQDSGGRPVAGATAWVVDPKGGRMQAATDAQGLFRLEDVDSSAAFLFIESAGFRFHGQVVLPAASPQRVTLTRTDEPPAARMTTLPPVLLPAEERALVRRLLGPYAERVLKEGDESTLFRTLTVLAKVDPARVLEIVATKRFKTDKFDDSLRAAAAGAMLRTNPAEAETVIETIVDPERRALAFLDACDNLPPTDRTGKLRRLDQSLLAARAAPKPEHQLVAIGRVAEHWLDLGETDKAMKLLREFQPVAAVLPAQGWAGYARGAFAEELAQVDTEAAPLTLIAGLDEGPQPDRHRLNIAQELASRNPAEAERVLGGLRDPESLGRNLSRIVYAMTPKDRDRAYQLIARVSRLKDEHNMFPFARPHALAMMALALADSDRPAASWLLREAFDDLKQLANESRRGFQDLQDAPAVAAALLPVAERIDPALVPEYFWRAASFRGPGTPASRPRTTPDATLALFLARYDRMATPLLLEPILARGLADPAVNRSAALWAEAAIDPRRAIALVDAMPDDPDAGLNPFKDPKNEARLDLALVLATPAESRWDEATHRVLYLWTMGTEDIF